LILSFFFLFGRKSKFQAIFIPEFWTLFDFCYLFGSFQFFLRFVAATIGEEA